MTGQRFSVTYRLAGSEAEARAQAEGICIEQTVEFPPDLLPLDFSRSILGRIETFGPHPDGRGYLARISYAEETAGREFTQYLNVVFGNSSLKPGLRVERLDNHESSGCAFRGPRFGKAGLRLLLQSGSRPLLCTALKPMGLSAEGLADLAYRFAQGGIDIIKDDHGLADQAFAPFEARVRLCSRAVARANAETGQACVYVPNVTAGPMEMIERARLAKAEGAGGLLIAPGLAGWESLRRIAEDDRIGLPVLAHPAFNGTLVVHPESGISPRVLYGQLPRLAGADAVIYPNFGGRFAFTPDDCRAIIQGCEEPMGNLPPIFPCPGGGLGLERVKELQGFYGDDVIFLIGGGLFRPGPDLIENCRYFRELVGSNQKE